MWHYTFTINMQGETPAFQYFGPELVAVFGEDYSGVVIDDAVNDSLLGNTIGFYRKAVETRSPVSESSSFFMDGKEVRYRSLIVPLSTDGKTVDYLLGTTNYKVF